MTDSAAIDAQRLGKCFHDRRINALDNVNFQAGFGDLVAITGPSGSGKSTLLYALSGLMPLDAGHVHIAGQAPTKKSEWTALRRRTIGMIFQDDWLLPTLTASENVELPMLGVESDAGARRERVDALLEKVGAGAIRDRLPDGLSGGERQRVAIARGLANSPRILMADEPTGDLDSVSVEAILSLLIELWAKEGLTILLVTHDATVAARCRRHFVMRDGKGAYA